MLRLRLRLGLRLCHRVLPGVRCPLRTGGLIHHRASVSTEAFRRVAGAQWWATRVEAWSLMVVQRHAGCALAWRIGSVGVPGSRGGQRASTHDARGGSGCECACMVSVVAAIGHGRRHGVARWRQGVVVIAIGY